MKTKNVIFRLLAVIVAVGGAMASVNASLGPNDAHLSYVTIGGNGFCVTIAPNPCGQSGPEICRLQISVNNSPTIVTAWNHRATPGVCVTRLTRPAPGGVIPVLVNMTIPAGSIIQN